LFGKLSFEEKKDACYSSKLLIFLQESLQNKKFLSLDSEKLSASEQGQATKT
jgi:hypothetical protein